MKLRIINDHTPLIGKLAKLTAMGLHLEQEYQTLFEVGNYFKAQLIHYYCYLQNKYEINLIFIDEAPIKRDGLTWFCLKEIGNGVHGDYHWFTLDQLMVCN